jgi:2-succinyl-6-hydroxy-2,4-cyclohexadiene-1-carboxylate synthase
MTPLVIKDVHLNLKLAGSGQPLVLLHGFTGSAVNWEPHSAIFSKHYTTIAIDLLGHGGSDSPANPGRYSMERCVEDLIAVFDQLAVERVNLLGYSMGGRVALHVAATHPERVRALVLESASPGLADPAERQARAARDEALAKRIEREGLEAFANHWEELPLFASQSRLPETVRSELRAQRLRNNPLGLANSLRGLGAGAQPPLWHRLPDLHIPTLLVVGELDLKFVSLARAMAQALPKAKLELVSDAGHAVHLERPAEFDRLVLAWLSNL